MGRFQADAFNSSTHPNPLASADSAIPASILAEQLKLNAPSHNSSQLKAIAAVPSRWLKGMGDRLITVLSQLPSQLLLQSDQPQIRWWRDAEGHDRYSVYDPISQKTQIFDNARQVRTWLEQRYYQ